VGWLLDEMLFSPRSTPSAPRKSKKNQGWFTLGEIIG